MLQLTWPSLPAGPRGVTPALRGQGGLSSRPFAQADGVSMNCRGVHNIRRAMRSKLNRLYLWRMAKIFISYRRDDAEWQAHELYSAILRVPGVDSADVFIDVDGIPLGVDFNHYIDRKVAEADVLLAVIGRHWADSRNPTSGELRLHDPEDFVRIEIASALRRNIKVIPIFLDGAKLPSGECLPDDLKGLRFRNGIEMTRQSFDSDLRRLLSGLSLQAMPSRQVSATSAPAAMGRRVASTSDSSFEVEVVLASKSYAVIAFFGAVWCGPSQRMRPQFEKAVREMDGLVRLAVLDIDESPDITKRLNIREVPAVYAYYQGQPVDSFAGNATPERISNFVRKHAARAVG
jgi:thiol-disulfide isomerase/thioredoxin